VKIQKLTEENKAYEEKLKKVKNKENNLPVF
jgi:hypothetical protein